MEKVVKKRPVVKKASGANDMVTLRKSGELLLKTVEFGNIRLIKDITYTVSMDNLNMLKENVLSDNFNELLDVIDTQQTETIVVDIVKMKDLVDKLPNSTFVYTPETEVDLNPENV